VAIEGDLSHPAAAILGVPLNIYVDADACPVKDEVVRVAERHKLQVQMVSNSYMRLPDSPLVTRIVVDDGPDVADDWIADHITKGDIAVTADIPLAARCVKAGAKVIGPTGKPFTDANIGMALAMRDLNSDLRESGEIKGYNASFTKKDRSQFLQALEQAVQDILRGR
jgi:uncharacterized protein YaiI (UPF0178 family)